MAAVRHGFLLTMQWNLSFEYVDGRSGEHGFEFVRQAVG